MINLILCGGSGTRLWPLSRNAYPKQFVNLIDNESLFKKTIERNLSLCSEFFIVTNKQHVFIASEQYDDVVKNKDNVKFILEPMGRNTAPAIALACFDLDPEEIVFVSPSDHLILDLNAYKLRVAEAEKLAEAGYLVTFGIQPTFAETGFGYIEVDENASLGVSNGFKVLSFREKPDIKTAESFISAGNFLWNSGMFVFKAGVYLSELMINSPEIYEKSKNAFDSAEKYNDVGLGHSVIKIQNELMSLIPSNSIDYAVMEKSKKVACVKSSFGWNDLGSFDSLYALLEKDSNGNTNDANLIQTKSKNNLVISEKRKIALVGIEDCIVIDTDDAVLVAKKGESQNVKEIVEQLKNGNNKEQEMTEYHTTVYRPWGSYTLLAEYNNFKVKKIIVKPGKKLSLQKHMHRNEHWVVVSGTATVTVGVEVKVLQTNESVYIPISCNHRLENEGKIDLVIIETQVGQYLGEDDIIRLEDVYGRS